MGVENPGQYVYAIGLILTPDSKGGYNVAKVVYSEPGTTFYKPFQNPPANMANILAQADSSSVDTFNRLYIPGQAKIQFTNSADAPFVCPRYGIFFEQLYAKPHFYCIHNGTYSEINDNIHILFKDTKYRIVITQDSQIYGSYKIQ